MNHVPGGNLTLDDLVPTEWEDGDAKSIDRWGLGDLLGPTRMTWIGPTGHDRVTDVTVDSDQAAGTLVAVSPPDQISCAIVVSQTCDVVSTGPGARHPFVQVSPVIVTTRTGVKNLDRLAHWEVRDRALLSPSRDTVTQLSDEDPADVVLIADLRVSIPVSKALLAGREPQPGFAEEMDLLAFAEHLALKTCRPALHGFVTDTARTQNQDAIRNDAKTNTAWWSQVDEVRVRCRPTRLYPKQLEFFIVHNHSGPPDPASVDRWNQIFKTVRKAGRREGIEVFKPVHETIRDFRAETYRQTVALDLPEIKRGTDVL